MAYRDVEELLPDQEGAADTAADPPGPPPPQEEEADTPKDLSEPAPLPVEPADRRNTPSEMVIPQIYEVEAAREAPPVLVDPPPVLATPPVVVESQAVAHSPVQLERSQRTMVPPSYLKDFLCDAVEKHPSASIKEVWGDGQLRVATPRYKETQL